MNRTRLVARSKCFPCAAFGRLCLEHRAARTKAQQAARKREGTRALQAELAALRKQLEAAQRDLAAYQARDLEREALAQG